MQAIRELKRDKSGIVLTVNKGVAMVVMDRQESINKSINFLTQPANRPIPKDLTSNIKAKKLLYYEKLKRKQELDNNTYKYMYTMGCNAPKFYWLPKIHKLDTPLGL